MTVGQLAKAAGVNVETIRYYQRRGLLPTPAKPLNGQRSYPPEALRQLTFIRRAQELGFTLDEILSLLDFARSRAHARVREMAAAKLEELAQRTAELNRITRKLRMLIAKSDKGVDDPLLQALYAEAR